MNSRWRLSPHVLRKRPALELALAVSRLNFSSYRPLWCSCFGAFCFGGGLDLCCGGGGLAGSGSVELDSEHVATFDDDDKRGLERVVRWFAGRPSGVVTRRA